MMEYEVASISYDRRNFFAHKHEQIFEYEQARLAKESFAASAGKKIKLPMKEFANLEIFVEGQLTVYREDGESIGEYSHGADFLSVNRCDCLVEKFTEKFQVFEINDAISFLAPGAYNIHHFFFEVLPVIYANRDLIRNRKVMVPSTKGGGGFFEEFNELLNLEMEIIEIPVESIVRGKNITVFGTFPFRIYPLSIVKEIKKLILDKITQTGSVQQKEIVYIGRGDTERDRRKISNEESVFELLNKKELNFSIIRPGLIPIEESIRALVNAKTIIGPTGGALFHQVWSRKLLRIIELKPLRYESMTETEELSKFFDYSYLDTPTLPKSNGFWSNSNQAVELSKLEKLIDCL